MATKKAAATATRKRTAPAFSEDERKAMKEYSEEKKRARKRGGKQASKEDGTKEVQDAIAKMADEDAALATKVHEIITDVGPDLMPRTWYGMPAYAKDGDVICFFQNAGKFKARYSTLGFSDKAQLDEGTLWPNSYAVTTVDKAAEKKIRELVKRAIG